MGRDTTTYCCALALFLMLLAGVGMAAQHDSPATMPQGQPMQTQPPPVSEEPAPGRPKQIPLPQRGAGSRRTECPVAGSVGWGGGNHLSRSEPSSLSSGGSLATVPPPQATVPLAHSASRSETNLRIEDLMRGAAALRMQGNYPKAMALYNDALDARAQTTPRPIGSGL